MSLPSQVCGQLFLVLGLGRTGLAVCQALKAVGAVAYAWDDSKEQCAVALEAGFPLFKESPETWGQLHGVIVSPGISWRWPAPHPLVLTARRLGVACMSDIDIFTQTLFRLPSVPRLIGVTGTNGKSTTTALMGHVLQGLGQKVHVGGNIGVPVLSLAGAEAYVLELSSYQLDLSRSLFLHDAVLLNMSLDHLTRHGGVNGYVAAKRLVFEGLNTGGRGIIGVDDPYCQEMYEELRQQFGDKMTPLSVTRPLERGVYVERGELIDACEGSPRSLGRIDEMPTLVGQHNYQNMLAVYAALRFDAPQREDIVALFRSFPGLAHRQERVARIGTVMFINDSKATNGDAAEKALRSYENIYWIAGGVAKEGGIQGLEPSFSRIKHAFLIGQAADTFALTLGAEGVPFTVSHTLERAVEEATQLAAQDAESSVVLLSPACASFDQFKDFEERGDQFKAAVERLKGRRGH